VHNNWDYTMGWMVCINFECCEVGIKTNFHFPFRLLDGLMVLIIVKLCCCFPCSTSIAMYRYEE